MSTNYRSMIDEALASAKSRLNTEVPQSTKIASAPVDGIMKEASDLADALEYISYSSGSDGTVVGDARNDMIRSFFKVAAEGGSPAQSSTQAKGVQSQVPSEGKKKLNPKGLVGGASPAQSSAQPEAKDGQKPLLESMKQAEGNSLYDILMNSKEAGQNGGPSESTATEAAEGIPSGNENSNRQSLLGSNEAPVNATKRQAKAPVRARLAEAFSHTSDTLGDASASAVWPQAAAKGDMKVASVSERLDKIAGQREAALVGALPGMAPFNTAAAGALSEKGRGWRTAGGQLGGAMLGGMGGAALGMAAMRGRGLSALPAAQGAALLGSSVGGGLGAYLAHGKDSSPKEKLLRMKQQAEMEKLRGVE